MPDFNKVVPGGGDALIPKGTKCKVCLSIVPGGLGQGGVVTRSQTSTAEFINTKLTVLDGPFAGHSFRYPIGIQGKQPGPGDYYAEQGLRSMRQIIDAAFGLNPHDTSETAVQTRIMEYEGLEGLVFPIEVGVVQGTTKQVNTVARIITPDQDGYDEVMGVPDDEVPF